MTDVDVDLHAVGHAKGSGDDVGIGRQTGLLLGERTGAHHVGHFGVVGGAVDHSASAQLVNAAVAHMRYGGLAVVEDNGRDGGAHAVEVGITAYEAPEFGVGILHGRAKALAGLGRALHAVGVGGVPAGMDILANGPYGYRRGRLAAGAAPHTVAHHHEECSRERHPAVGVLVLVTAADMRGAHGAVVGIFNRGYCGRIDFGRREGNDESWRYAHVVGIFPRAAGLRFGFRLGVGNAGYVGGWCRRRHVGRRIIDWRRKYGSGGSLIGIGRARAGVYAPGNAAGDTAIDAAVDGAFASRSAGGATCGVVVV